MRRYLTLAFFVGFITGACVVYLAVDRYEVTTGGRYGSMTIKLDKLTGKAWSSFHGQAWRSVAEEAS